MCSPLATCKKLRLCPEKPDSGWRSEANSKSLAGNYVINYVRPRLSLVTVFMYLVAITCNLNKTRRQMGRLMKGLRQRRKWSWALEGRVDLSACMACFSPVCFSPMCKYLLWEMSVCMAQIYHWLISHSN